MTRERGRDVAVLAMSSYTPVDCPLSSPQSLSVSLSPALLGGGALTHLPTVSNHKMFDEIFCKLPFYDDVR